jgi:hypothetical protein
METMRRAHGALLPRSRLGALLVVGALTTACSAPDPKQELELFGFETYWVVDRSVGGTNYLAPAARFHLRHKGSREHRAIQATATFRRAGEEATWGSAWVRVGPSDGPLRPGDETLVVLVSDARYTSPDPPELMLQHELFEDARVEVFVRVGASPWVKLGEGEIERRIGTRAIEGIVAPESSPGPEAAASEAER